MVHTLYCFSHALTHIIQFDDLSATRLSLLIQLLKSMIKLLAFLSRQGAPIILSFEPRHDISNNL